jgi:uncharacterized protein with PhoU and TrkA domain
MEDEIRYRPISVRELLSELQTASTLMIDLAYSSILFNDKDLAEEVIETEREVEELKTTLMMNTAIVIRDAEDAEGMIGIMEMGSVADTISHAAGTIARTTLLDLDVDPSIRKAFTKTQERIVRTKIVKGSVLIDKSLNSLKLEINIGVDVMAVRRGQMLHTAPSPDMKLKEADILIARGSDVGVSELEKLAKGELPTVPMPKPDLQGEENE